MVLFEKFFVGDVIQMNWLLIHTSETLDAECIEEGQ